ncbi:histone deacetylase [Flavihumibacter sp. CACIAM 22H1]|uniref:histone deacetylase family protein n=1 Tax=Flavihumibacter sp. CACIAM 22H1 TaxID=1812911 RepID=UPI0007A7D0C4|nr:histone deacetylase [Flavihumibacter sp. CACIAM 22H1]KYP13517.1 MAG: deacetylase [Flavihumibacter sp. CACIAM 22H1]
MNRYIAFDPIYAHPLPAGHRFPMLKYELIPAQLLYESIITEKELYRPNSCAIATVLKTHTEAYVQKLIHQQLSAREQRHIGFPQSPALTQRELIITQGTIDCADFALSNGVALNVAGGTHHAFADRGEGFCLLNDVGVAANYLLEEKKCRQILVIDLDVHQGNGTAKLFENKPAVFTFSMHGRHNYPFHKEQSDLDIPLEDGIGNDAYLFLLEEQLTDILNRIKPDLAFYIAGVDILETDKFGKLNISKEGCRLRDRMVFTYLQRAGIPCVVSMGGGYSPDIRDIVEAHCNTFREAFSIY